MQCKFNVTMNLHRVISALILTEPLWFTAVAACAYMSLMLGIKTWLWPAMALCFLPPILSYLKDGTFVKKTPFDLPLALFWAAVICGALVSNYPEISLNAVLSLVVITLFYYTITGYPNNEIVKYWFWLILLLVPVCFGFAMYALNGPNLNPQQYVLAPDIDHRPFHPNMLPILAIIIGCLLLGFIIKEKSLKLRLFLGSILTAVFVMFLYAGQFALYRLFNLISINERILVWRDALRMLGNSWITGIGFGRFAAEKTTPVFFGLLDPHNIFVDSLLSTGLVGLMALAIFIVFFIRISIIIIREPHIIYWSSFGIGLLLLFVVLIFMGIIDGFMYSHVIFSNGVIRVTLSMIPWLIAAFQSRVLSAMNNVGRTRLDDRGRLFN